MGRYHYYVYILTNKHHTVFYIGMTNDIHRRLREHRKKTPGSFTAKYQIWKLVHLEEYAEVRDAIHREKQLKNWHRQWKIDLILKSNPAMMDLAADMDAE